MKYIYKYIVAAAFMLSVSGTSAYGQEYKELVEKILHKENKNA